MHMRSVTVHVCEKHKDYGEPITRTPGPATAKMMEYAKSYIEWGPKERGYDGTFAEACQDFIAELSTNANAPACEDRGGEEA
jgi:hypothetical protein